MSGYIAPPTQSGLNEVVGSLTVLSSGPYAPNLPGTGGGGQVALTPTPAGIAAGKAYDFGGRAFHAGAFGAKGDGTTDDTTAIAAAITAATPPLGGEVFLGAGTYKTTAALTIPSTVWLVGAKSPMGMVFGDTLSGAILQPTTGAFNCVQTPSATQNRGGGLMDIGLDGFTDTSHWLVRVFGATGFTMLNVAARQAATNAQGILIGGGTGSALQCFLSNVSLNSGGGFTGNVGIQFGISGSEIANANTGVNVEIQGYTTNLNLDNGGNSFHQVWVQFAAVGSTGIRFNSSEGAVFGGWMESLLTGIVFTATSTNCLAIGMRKIGTVATLYTDAGTGNRLIALDGNDYGNVALVGTFSAGKISSNTGTPGLEFFDRTGAQHWQLYGASSIARLYNGTTDVFAIDAFGHLFAGVSGAPATTNLGANVTSATFTGTDVCGTIAVVMSGALAANTRICTATFANSYGGTAPKITLVNQTSGAGLTIVNFYVLAQSTGVSFDLAADQALAAGTYTVDYIVIGTPAP